MSIVIDETSMIEQSQLIYEEKLKSPIRRFTDKTFTPVDYFHIKANRTTTDPGYGDVSEILGKTSPIHFDKISRFPLYGLEPLTLQLNDNEQGLDNTFESEATIMAGTIVPFQNDYFVFSYGGVDYVFRITSVENDTVSSAPFYKVNYILEYIDNETKDQLNSQTTGEFTCVLENIGTDERCIVETELKGKIDEIEKMYDEMVNCYLTFYYNERYNCLLGDFGNGLKIFDPFMLRFITDHKLFMKKNQIDSIVMVDQFDDPRRKIKYNKTIYHFFETRRMEDLTNFNYTVFKGTSNPSTAFYRWIDESVMILDIPKEIGNPEYYALMPDALKETIRMNLPSSTKYVDLLKRYARKEDITIDEIDLSLSDEILSLDDANLEVFFYTPILLFIIREVVSNGLRTEFYN